MLAFLCRWRGTTAHASSVTARPSGRPVDAGHTLCATGAQPSINVPLLHPVRNARELVLFLVSDRASFGTGAYYNADGGYLAQ